MKGVRVLLTIHHVHRIIGYVKCSRSDSILTWAVEKENKKFKKPSNAIWRENNVCPVHIVLRTH